MDYNLTVETIVMVDSVGGETNPELRKTEGDLLAAFKHSFLVEAMMEYGTQMDAINILDSAFSNANILLHEDEHHHVYQCEFNINFAINCSSVRKTLAE